ncbi:MAG: DUF5667 domain-containing protein [Victivallales bacterium]
MKESMENIFDRCLEDIASGRAPGDVLDGYKEHPEYGRLREMLYFALDLNNLQTPPATEIPDFSSLLDPAANDPVKKRLVHPFQLIMRIAAAFILASIILLAGTSQASSGALPGDMLYPVKRNFERLKFACTFNGKGKAEFKMACSNLRLSEAIKLNERCGKTDTGLFTSMFDDSRYALEKAYSLPSSDRDEIIFRTAYLIKKQKEGMMQLYKSAPENDRTGISHYLCACGKRDELMDSMLGIKISLPSEKGCSDMDTCCGCSEGAECRVSSEEMSKMKKSIQYVVHRRR